MQPDTLGGGVRHPFDFDHEPRLAPDARRFGSGTITAAGIAGLDAASSTVLQIGRQAVEDIVDKDADAAIYRRLTERDVRCSLRATGIRFSPYYKTRDDLQSAAAAIAGVAI